MENPKNARLNVPASPVVDVSAHSLAEIEEANVAALLSQLKAGKPLSAAQQKIVTDYKKKLADLAATATNAATAPGAPRVADSMEAASALTGIHRDIIARAKAAGCPAFRGSRVYVDELVEWLEENAESLPTGNTVLDEINQEIQRQKLRKITFANNVEEGRYIRREDQAAQILALGIALKNTLRKKLEEELPDKLANRSREEVLHLARELMDEICRLFREGTKQWSQPTQN
jgi:hypothetical protein